MIVTVEELVNERTAAELEAIKAEIEKDWQLQRFPSAPFSCGLRRAAEIIDKHINKLKEI